MQLFVKILNSAFLLLLFSLLGCFGGESTVDEDYHPGVAIKKAATLEIAHSSSLFSIDTGGSYSFGRQIIFSQSEVSFKVTNTGERTATGLSANTLETPFSYKGGAYPGTNGTCGETLEASASCLVSISYNPTEVESNTTQFILNYQNGRVVGAARSVTKDISGEGYSLSPAISGILPLNGSALGGTPITITGTYFRSGMTVSLGGANCSNVVVASSRDSLTCTTTAHAVGTVSLTLTNEFAQSSTLADTFTYLGGPTVSSISPNWGSTSGSTTVTITGSGFVAGTSVTIGGSSCTAVTVNSATSLTCSTAAHAAGAVDVVLTNPDTQTGTGSGLFTYSGAPTVSSITQEAGAVAGGNTVTINGTGFFSGTTVSIGGSSCTGVTINSSTQLTCTTTTHANSAQAWSSTSTTSAPSIRQNHSAVWTGA